MEYIERQNTINAITNAAILPDREVALSAAAIKEREQSNASEKLNKNNNSSDEEEDFLKKYRAKRLQELHNTSNWPTFGEVREVGPFEYAEIVDETDCQVVIVVHLYESQVRECSILNNILDSLAQKKVRDIICSEEMRNTISLEY